MNVAFDPWIPVVTISGKPTLASLAKVLSSGEEFADLAVRPHERVALMRLFLCVAHAALKGPKDYDEWKTVPQRLPDASQKYLKKWKGSFELFDNKKPWLQVADLDILPSEKEITSKLEKSWSPLRKLNFTLASGSNTSLFDHESTNRQLTVFSAAEITLNLLTFQNFFVAGGKASSRIWGTTKMINPPNPKGGPCAGKSILFTFLRRKNLKETFHFNLSTHDDLELSYEGVENWLGKPIWETPIKSPKDEKGINNATRTHMGRLVPQTRILRIHNDHKRVLLGAGFLYPKFQDEQNIFNPDIFATIRLNSNNEHQLLSAKPDIGIWRELHALLIYNKNTSTNVRGPLCLLNLPPDSDCDITVNAMITNPERAAEIIDLIESVFHIPIQLTAEPGIAAYNCEVQYAENTASRLGSAINIYRKEVDKGWEGKLKAAGPAKGKLKAKLHKNTTTHYWTTIEKHLSLLMKHIKSIGTDDAIPTRKNWRNKLFQSACDAYQISCGQETPRQMRAFAKGWQKLTDFRNNPEPRNNNNMKEKP